MRYHRMRWSSGAADGRSKQELKAAVHSEAITHWRDQQEDRRVNLGALHDWLRCEHAYDGRLESAQSYRSRTCSAPANRARWRVEAPGRRTAENDAQPQPAPSLRRTHDSDRSIRHFFPSRACSIELSVNPVRLRAPVIDGDVE
jgi:hypothetical protein